MRRFVATVGVAALLAAGWTRPASAQGRFLAKDDILLYGLGLRVEPASQTVPKDIATIVSTYLQAPQQPTGLPPFAPDAVVKATLRGPGLTNPLDLQVQPNAPFNIPPLKVAGVYTLENVRLESGGAVLLRATPESARITVIDKLLVTQITARPLTAAEIREKGIVFDASNFQAYNFTAAFALKDSTNTININVPVLLPSVQGAAGTAASTATIPAIAAPAIKSLKTVIPDTLKLTTQIPNLSVMGFQLTAPALEGQDLLVPPIPGVIVIPGDIGFLNQYFSVMLMVGNAAPAGSGLDVTDLSAQVILPAGNDRVANSADDPLRMAMTTKGESPRVQPVVQAGADGELGTADDIVTIGPGESGSAEFLVEGRREGSHIVEMAITGTLQGLPVGPVPITGRAAGAVLVRNPAFTLTFTHPESVAAGEPYSLDVTVTNTSTSPANFVSLNLYGPNVSGATVLGEPTRDIETIPPGDSATVSFDLVSRLSGKVTASTLDSDENVSGRFQLKSAVGADGIPLSPDSLVLPKEANALPKSLRDAALGLLGKAWAVATAPAGALPKDVVRFSKQIVIDRAIEVAEAGLRVSLHEPLADSAAQLLMDFAGSNYGRIADLYAAADQPFSRDNFTGFDALRRTSVRGDAFAGAVAALLADDLAAAGPAAFHRALGAKWNYRPGFISVLVSGQGAPAPFDAAIVDPQGRTTGGTGANGKVVKEIPFSDVVAITNGSGQRMATLLLIAAPDPGAYTIRLSRIAGTPADSLATMSVLAPTADANGDLTQLVFEGLSASSAPSHSPAPADPYRFAFEMIGGDLAASPSPIAGAAATIPDALPSVVSVVQQAGADLVSCDEFSVKYPMGRIVAVLFSEDVTADSVQDRIPAELITAFAPEANRAVGVALQPGRRIAFVALREPFGPYVPRTMAVTGVEDLRGHAIAPWSGAMEATVGDKGAVVSGRIIEGDGTPVAGANVRLYAMLPCEPTTAQPLERTMKIGIGSKYADGEGRYSWDFVNSDLRAVITAIEPVTEEFRTIPFDISRPGQRLNVDIVLLGRGTFMGRVLAADGRTPLPNSRLRVTSLTDQSQYGATTDAQGAFVIARIPVGNIFVEAVNVAAKAHYNFSEYIPFAGATVVRDIALVPADLRQITIAYGTVSGHVLKVDGATPVAGAPVVAYYQSNSQAGVSCPPVAGEPVPECAVGVATTGTDGAYSIAEIPQGSYRLYAFDQPSLAQGEVRYTLSQSAGVVTILLSGGLATVTGTVVDSAGAPVPGARVGGGLTLTTADANGVFTLTDVPVGRRTIVAVSDALGVQGSAEIDIARAGEVVNVTIVMPASGSVAGQVKLADGATPAEGVTVYAFQRTENGVIVLGQATTDATGAYRIDRMLPGQYQVSAFKADFSDGNVVTAVLRYDRQVVRADIRFRGAGGRVSGTVYNSDGTTPLAARVGLSGLRVRIAGGRVGVGFQPVANYAIVDTGLDGQFSFSNLFVGDFTLRAVGAFSPDPIAATGRLDAPDAQVTVDLRLQATSSVAGIVYQPDGVTPAANVNVLFKSDAFRTVCALDKVSEGNLDGCELIPQGIQSEYAVSDASGRFLVPLVNAGAFTLTFEDPATGKVAQVRASVRPGERAEIPVRLLGRGVLTIHVLSSDGHTPIPGASVDVRQSDYPRGSASMSADAQGTLVLGGGDAFSEGDVAILVRDVRNGFTGRGSARITSDDEQVSVNVYIYDAWGTVSGTVFKSDGITPVPNAEVIVSVGGKPIGYTVADANGRYTQDTVPLGPFSIDVFEAATARVGYASGRIDLDRQQVLANVVEAAIGLVTGTVLDSAVMEPLAGWSVSLRSTLGSGRRLAMLQGMTAADGTFSFPGVAKGVFTLRAAKAGVDGTADASGEIFTEGQLVDVPLLVPIARTLYGTIEGTVRNPDGTPAAFATVSVSDSLNTVAASDGTFAFPTLALGRYQLTARAQASANAGSVWADLAFDGDLLQVTIPMVGLTAVHGQVVHADNSPAAGVQVVFSGVPASGCDGGCTKFADANGEFSFAQLPARSFTLWAIDTVRNLKGSVGGALNPGEDKALRVVLQPAAEVQGRVLTAGGVPAAGVTCELVVGGQHLFLGTGSDGRFSYPAVPLAPYTLSFADPVGPGIARRTGTLTADVDFGDVFLDEAPPQVVSLTPVASASRVPLTQVVTIVFSEAIDPAGVTAAGMALAGPAGTVAGVLALGAGDTTVTLTPLAPLTDESRYTLTLRGIKDRLGKAMPDYTASFTTVDITPPSVADLSPAQGVSGVPVYSPVRIKFTEPVDPAGFSGMPVSLTVNGAAVPGRLDYLYGNTVIVFTPSLPLADGSVYRVQIAAARDLAGNVQAQGLDFTFATTDGTPPVVASLAALTGATVIEGTIARVRPNVGTAADVSVVDYYLNGLPAGSARVAPFDFAFQVTPSLGAPGDVIAVTAIATDTSGNRGPLSAPLSITVTADQPPAVSITAPAGTPSYRNGDHVTVTLRATDDVGLVALGYKALTGRPQDAATTPVSPAATDRTASFGFDIPADAAPGTAIQIQASAVDSKGQTTAAAQVSVTVIDAVAPVVAISGSASGDKVKAGQTVSAALNVSDAGGLKQVTFTAAGAAAASETRPIAGEPKSLVTSFTFTVSPTARTGDTVALDATATDAAGNVGTAARVVLTVGDVTPPSVSLRTSDGSTAVLPGQTVDAVVVSEDDQAVTRVDLTGQGAFTLADSQQVSPPSNSATTHFAVIVPTAAQPGELLTLTARATDVAGNTSGPVTLVLRIASPVGVTMPASIVVLAGDTQSVAVSLSTPAPAGGQQVTFTSANPAVAAAPGAITVPEGQTEGSVTVTALTGGTTYLRAYVQGAFGASTTVAVQGGVVSGIVYDDLLTPVAGADVTVGTSFTAITDNDGFYRVTGVGGTNVGVRAVDPASRKRGSVTAHLSGPGGFAKHVNVVLIAAGGVTGTVFMVDGTTPAGPGVQVDIYDASQPSRSLGTAFTGDDSRYAFPVVTPGAYVVDARSVGGQRGRTSVAAVAGEDTTADIVYLGSGAVAGVVRDGGGAPVPNAQVVLNATSVFGAAAPVTIAAQPDGSFSFPSVFIGSFWIRATDPRTSQAGVASGVVGQQGETVTLDVYVAAFGSLQGTVYRSDGATTVANASVTVSGGGKTLSAGTDSGGHYDLPVVPLGTYTVEAREAATRGIGRTTATLSANAELVTANVTLEPQGTLIVTVTNSDGTAAAGAKVVVASARGSFEDSQSVLTGTDGRAVVSHVLAGSFTASASLGSLSGVAVGTLDPNATIPVAVQLAPPVATGSIAGTVVMPNGQTPAAGVVRLRGSYSSSEGGYYQQAPLGADGSYRFDGVTANGYKVYAYDQSGRWRAVSGVVTVTTQGQVVAADMTFVGLGTVSGRVLNIDSSSAGNTPVEIRSLNPTFGAYRTTKTDAAGNYSVANIAVGAVEVLAGSVASGLFAEASGTLPGDGETLTIDLVLKNNSTYFPVTLRDANAMPFEIEASAMVKRGAGYVFDAADGGGLKLELERDGVTTAFSGASIGTLEAGGRQVVAREQGLAGLDVTRRVYVPVDGYFARYVDVLTNPGTAPVTVNVWLTSYIGASQLLATSSGDAALNVDAAETADRWFTVDDASDASSSDPALAFVFDGPGAAVRAAAAAFAPSNSAYWRWNDVTVPAGGSVAFMHFAAQQQTRAAAQASAERLVQLPPEALASLRQDELTVIQNFAIPAEGVSLVAPLPLLSGTVTGLALESDGTSPVPSAKVMFTSASPYFPRMLTVWAGAGGRFTIEAKLDGSDTAFAVPATGFSLSATYPGTSVPSPVVAGAFGPGQALASQDILFTTTAGIRGSVRRADGTVAGPGTVTATGTWNSAAYSKSAPIGVDGGFTFSGQPPIALLLTASVPHAQGSAFTATANVALTAGGTQDVLITLPPVGAVSGTVRSGAGAAAANVSVKVAAGSFMRATTTDTAGHFDLAGVPVGAYTLTATEPASGLPTNASIAVAADQTTTQDLQLVSVGIVRGIVKNASNAVVANVPVKLVSSVSARGTLQTTTSASGAYQFTGVPVGSFLVSATSSALGQYGEVTGSVTSDGQQVVADITMAVNILSLPRTRYDGNGLRYDVQQSGKIRTGYNSVFRGASSTAGDAYGASMLSLVAGGTATAFTGAATAIGEHGNREFAIAQQGLAGLDVTRKLYVPETGYFTRYLEILSNPGAAPVTVDVKVASSLGSVDWSYWNGMYVGTWAYIKSTSSGDATLDVSGAAPDQWVVVDDSTVTDLFDTSASPSGFPAAAFVFDGPGAATRVTTATYTSPDSHRLVYQWNNVTVPAGGKVILMHFVLQQSSTAAGSASAARLMQLPPEGIFGIEDDERPLVANFAVPADGVSALDALPALSGTVNGKVQEVDGTAVASSEVRFASSVPYFGRAYRVSSGATGTFSFTSQLDGANSSNRVLPVADFTLSAKHPVSSVVSVPVAGTFAENQSTATRDVVFTNTGTITGFLRRHTGTVVANNGVDVVAGTTSYYKTSDATGRFTFRGLPAGVWTLKASLSTNPWLTAVASATTVNGQTTTQDLYFEPSGRVRGIVYLATGAVATNKSVTLTRPDNSFRSTTSGADGSFLFADFPPGSYVLGVTDTRTSVKTTVPVSVVADQDTVQNITVAAAGSLQVQVNFARGVGAGGARVQVKDAGTSGNFSRTITTDAAGRGTVTNVAAGPVTVRASHPTDTTFYADVDTTLATEGQVVPVTVTLPSVSAVKGHTTVSTGTAVANVSTTLLAQSGTAIRSATTDATGTSDLGLVANGATYSVKGARTVSSYSSYSVTGQSGSFSPAGDGDTNTIEVTMPAVANSTVAVVTSDGTSFGAATLYLRNAYQANFAYQGSTNSTTGLRAMPLPEGPYTIRVMDSNTGAALVDYSGAITAADEAVTMTITVVVPAVSGTVTGQVFAADGVTPVASSRVYLINALDQQQITSMTTGADGRYTFSNVRAGTGGFIIKAALPSSVNDPTTVDVTGAFTTAGETVTLNVTMPFASMTVGGTAYTADGTTGLGYYRIVQVLNLAGAVLASARTDSYGAYGPLTVWASTAGVKVRAYEPAGIIYGEQTQLPGTAGGTFTVNVTVPVYSGTLQVTVSAADGQTRIRYADYSVVSPAGTLDSGGSTNSSGVLSRDFYLPTGGATFLAWYSDGTTADYTPVSVPVSFAANNATLTLNLRLPLSVVKVHAQQAGGGTVSVRDATTVGADSFARTYMTSDASGNYTILGTPPGPFRAYVEDRSSPYFTGFADATVADISVPVQVEVMLPAKQTIEVKTLDTAGLPVASTSVALSNPGNTFVNYSTSDAAGLATVTAPVGPVSLQACPGGKGCAVVSTAVVAGQSQQLELAPRPTGVLEGRLFKADGTTPLAAKTVRLESYAGSGMNGYWRPSGVVTDADGRFSVAGVPSGTIYVELYDSTSGSRIRVPVTVIAGQTNTMQAAAGSGVNAPAFTSGGATFAVASTAWLTSASFGSFSSPYSSSYYQYVNGISYSPNATNVLMTAGGNIAEFGPMNAEALIVQRIVGVPGNKPYIRYIEKISNPAGVPLPVSVKISTEVRDYNVVTGPAASGGRYVITGPSAGVNRPLVAHVAGGAGTLPVAPGWGVRSGAPPEYVWSTIVPAGGTVEFMHFSVLGDPADPAGLQAQAQALVDLTDPDALFGLSAEEKWRILNYNIPGAAAVTGSIGGIVVGQDGVTPVAGAVVHAMDAFNGHTWATVTTDATGTFRLDNIPNGERGVAVAATLAGYAGKSAGTAVTFTQNGQAVTGVVLVFPTGAAGAPEADPNGGAPGAAGDPPPATASGRRP